MAKEDLLELEGVVTEKFPGTRYQVKLSETEKEILCTIAGKLRVHNITITVGDTVTVKMSPYDLDKGIITWRKR